MSSTRAVTLAWSRTIRAWIGSAWIIVERLAVRVLSLASSTISSSASVALARVPLFARSRHPPSHRVRIDRGGRSLHACIGAILVLLVILVVLALCILGCLLCRQLGRSLLVEVIDVLSSQPCLLIFKLVLVIVGIHSHILDLEFVRLGCWRAAGPLKVLIELRIAYKCQLKRN